ncbi:ankyrin repeat domain-containing protein [Streptomyces sp. NPDC007088]|uniref:ankyrin repeat domain-containing protein n=1 Tax=Streptomyces sp. NPDC007088 TaxID=3364773 RepID=UPI0036A76DFF
MTSHSHGGSGSHQGGAGARLLEAAARGDEAGVREALDAGADPAVRDAAGRTPLLLAALGDHVAAAGPLVAAGADPDAQDEQLNSPWLVTGVTGSVAMMRALLPAHPDLTLRNRFGGIALIPACERGHVAYVRAALRETDMDVDHVNRLGWTALLEAVILGDGGAAHEEIVRLLLAAGATPDLPDGDGVTARQHARRLGFDRIEGLLRAAEATAG